MLHSRSNSNELSLLKLLALLSSPATSPPSIRASTSPGSSPWPIGDCLFAKCVNINLALLRIPATALFAIWSGQTVEKVVLNVNWLDSNCSRDSSRRSDLGKFRIRFLKVEFTELTFESLNLAGVR